MRVAIGENQNLRGINKQIKVSFEGDCCSLPQECKALKTRDPGVVFTCVPSSLNVLHHGTLINLPFVDLLTASPQKSSNGRKSAEKVLQRASLSFRFCGLYPAGCLD